MHCGYPFGSFARLYAAGHSSLMICTKPDANGMFAVTEQPAPISSVHFFCLSFAFRTVSMTSLIVRSMGKLFFAVS